MKHHIDNLKNFGFRGETVVEEPGINEKLNEVQAAYGLLQLKYVDGFIDRRKEITELYRSLLKDIPGICFLDDMDGVTHGYSYFPILIDKDKFGKSRDEVYELLKEYNIFARRYFYPLISSFEPYNKLKSSDPQNLITATKAAEQVLCLPIYVELEDKHIIHIIDLIK